MIACKLCSGKVFKEQTLFKGSTDKYKTEFFKYGRCFTCGSINNLSQDNPDYSDYATGTKISHLKVKRFERFLEKNGIGKHSLILDYGCGNGALFLELKKRGYLNTKGYEPFNEKYSDSINQDQKYEVVYLTHVFEHIPDYIKFFKIINTITAPKAKIITIHPSSTRVPPLDPVCPFQNYAFHAPFHALIPSDSETIKIFLKNNFTLQKHISYDIERSGIKDNNLVTALLARSLGGTKESWLGVSTGKKALAALSSPCSFLDKMFFHTKDYFVSTFIFEKK
ncbi:MAG TPA: class I SAM-dependent methyltransferase [Candidatus Nanoarchaeia archaeon]|nr:class I SAM-dependent methyltransferase [Candidatus Nanoarchaeia archaeon]